MRPLPRSPFSLASPSSSLPFFALSRVSCLLTDSHGHCSHIYSSYHNLSSSFNVHPPCQTLNFRKVGIFVAFDNEHCAWKTVVTTYLLTNCFEQSSIFRRQWEELKSTKLLFQGYMENLPDKIPYIKGDYRESYQVDGLDRQMKFSLVLPHSSVNEDVSCLCLDTMTISNIFPFGPELGLVISMGDPAPMAWIHIRVFCVNLCKWHLFPALFSQEFYTP